jgi:CRP-like cAMP-binding protein
MGLAARDWDAVMRAPLFKAMGPTISRAMIENRRPRSYARGASIFQQGDAAEGFFCVVEGWAKLFRLREDGEEVVVAIFSAGETFAEVAMFLGGRYPASCEAVSPARILKIDAANLRRAVLAQPQLAFDMLAAASLRLRQLVDEIEQLKAKSAPQRIADFFLKQAPAKSGPAEIALPYEKALIANRLGMKAESFSRALGRLSELGVTVDRESVRISDVDRLAAFAEGRRQPAAEIALRFAAPHSR